MEAQTQLPKDGASQLDRDVYRLPNYISEVVAGTFYWNLVTA